MKNLLNKYRTIEKSIHEYFGFEEDWRVLPIMDETEAFWFVRTGGVVQARLPFSKTLIEAGNLYTAEFYEPHGRKAVLRGKDFTMVSADTNTDFNVFLMVFDNTKELKDEELIDLCNELW